MAALSSVLVPRKVDEAWGSVTGPFVTINEVIFLYYREIINILDIIKKGDKSRSFETVCTEQGYQNGTLDSDLNFEDSGLETPRHTVHTDNGGELAEFDAFCETIAKEGYIVETTAPDASNQNGLAEQISPLPFVHGSSRHPVLGRRTYTRNMAL
jgi:hypothetical protein